MDFILFLDSFDPDICLHWCWNVSKPLNHIVALIYYNTVTYCCFTLTKIFNVRWWKASYPWLLTLLHIIYCIFSLILYFFATNNFFSHLLGAFLAVVNTPNIGKGFYAFFIFTYVKLTGLMNLDLSRLRLHSFTLSKVKRQNWMKDLIPSFCVKMIVWVFFNAPVSYWWGFLNYAKKKVKCEENIFAFYI